MPAPQRRDQPSLIRHLINQPQQFHFCQAVHVIDLWLRRGCAPHEQRLDTVLRFKNSVSLRFPGSQIEALSVRATIRLDSDAALQSALSARQLRHIHITPAFMGLLGVNGVLPYDYTDTIAAQIHFDKNEGGRAFFDAFSQRSMTLFYRAWEQCHIEYRTAEGSRDGFLPLQLAMAGKAQRSVRPANTPITEDVIADEVIAHYAALIRHRPVSGAVIAAVLSDYFGLPFRLEQFIGEWETQWPEEQTSLGTRHCQLGADTMIGPRYWRRDLCVAVWIGPLSHADFDRFLPLGSGSKALRALLKLFAVASIRFEIRLILRADDVQPVALDGQARLGYDSFLINEPATAHQQATRFYITF